MADSLFGCDACLTGCGGFFQKQFFHSTFPKFISDLNLHISALEFLAIIVGLKLWGKLLTGRKLTIGCDNLAVCIVINSGKSKCEFLQKCLREICFLAAIHDFQFRAQHIEGSMNRLADCLSRWHLNSSSQSNFYALSGSSDDLEEVLVDDTCFTFSHNW